MKWIVVTMVGLATAFGVIGCGGPAQRQSAPPQPAASAALPPRPVELPLGGVDPCALLTDDQRGKLHLDPGDSSHENFGGPVQGPVCVWTNTPKTPDNEYSGAAILNHGAEYALGAEALRTVDGFAATTTTSIGSDPNFYCGLLVDVAPGQALNATYDNPAKDYPGMNRQLACGKAQELAESMLTTLRAQQNR